MFEDIISFNETLLQKYQAEINALKDKDFAQRQKWVDKITEVDAFIQQFKQAPEVLFRKLKTAITQQIIAFDAKHFEQDDSVRACLFQVHEKLNQLEFQKIDTSTREDRQNVWRFKYLALCKFILDQQHYLSTNENTFDAQCIELCTIYLKLSGKIHVLNNHLEFPEAYLNNYSILDRITANHVSNIRNKEFGEFQEAYNQLKKITGMHTEDVYVQASHLADELQNDLRETSKKFESTNIKRYTEIVKLETKILNLKSEDRMYCPEVERLSHMTPKLKGQPSRKQKIVGGIVAFCGALILAGVIAAVVSNPVSLLAAIGVTSVLSQQLLVTGFAAAGAVTWSLGLFQHQRGQAHGIARAVKDFCDTTNTPPEGKITPQMLLYRNRMIA